LEKILDRIQYNKYPPYRRLKMEKDIEKVRCYVCNRKKPIYDMQACGYGIYRCKNHKVRTIIKACAKRRNTQNKKEVLA
jgi:hypothetical protein